MNEQQRIRKLERKLKKETNLANALALELQLLLSDPIIETFDINTISANNTIQEWKNQRCF